MAFTIMACSVSGQSNQSLYLFHWNPFKQQSPNIPLNKRRPKTRIEAGLVFGMLENDKHYTNTSQVKSGYTLGVKEEIPVLRKSAFMLGFDFYKQTLSFNSYFFAPGQSFLYDPTLEIYNHTLSIDEVHIPVEFKFSFKPESKNKRTYYGMFGWVYRLLLYDNALVINTQTGRFIYEGQNNLNYTYSLFANTGSSIIELGLGHQRNGLKNGNAFYWEIDYKYGISPIHYTGNNMGSNDVIFTLNTFTIKVGIKL